MKEFFPLNPSPLTHSQLLELNPLAMAYVGDSVHTLYVRSKIIASTTAKANVLHTMTTKIVNAKAQAQSMQSILPLLNDEENDIFHRARNSHVNTIAKNASLAEYKQATCFEALLGYLFLSGQSARAEFLLASAVTLPPTTPQ
ncbi:MAG: ribonuclease III domain-containing protein [Clostridia bacterium]